MRRVRFYARGVLVLSLVLALSAPVLAFPKRANDPLPRNPVSRLILKIVQIVTGDGLITPWPVTPPTP